MQPSVVAIGGCGSAGAGASVLITSSSLRLRVLFIAFVLPFPCVTSFVGVASGGDGWLWWYWFPSPKLNSFFGGVVAEAIAAVTLQLPLVLLFIEFTPVPLQLPLALLLTSLLRRDESERFKMDATGDFSAESLRFRIDAGGVVTSEDLRERGLTIDVLAMGDFLRMECGVTTEPTVGEMRSRRGSRGDT